MFEDWAFFCGNGKCPTQPYLSRKDESLALKRWNERRKP